MCIYFIIYIFIINIEIFMTRIFMTRIYYNLSQTFYLFAVNLSKNLKIQRHT